MRHKKNNPGSQTEHADADFHVTSRNYMFVQPPTDLWLGGGEGAGLLCAERPSYSDSHGGDSGGPTKSLVQSSPLELAGGPLSWWPPWACPGMGHCGKHPQSPASERQTGTQHGVWHPSLSLVVLAEPWGERMRPVRGKWRSPSPCLGTHPPPVGSGRLHLSCPLRWPR